MEIFAMVVFWFSIAAIFYSYLGFPLLVIVVGALRNRVVRKAEITPKVTLIITAWNEEKVIAGRLENALKLDYPSEKLEIIVASDGSDDRTDALVRDYQRHGVRLLSFPRRGKIFALNDAVAEANGEIIVFSDANSMYEPRALKMLIRNFADPEVGCVCGNQIYVKEKISDSTSQGENAYWNFDKWLKRQESRTGSIVSAHGAIYGIRSSLYQPLTTASVTDDFVISTRVIEQGYRLVFESEAVAFEESMPAAAKEFGRKTRLMNRGLRGVLLRRNLLNPLRHGFYAVELFSHKVLRRLAPFFLLLLLAASLFLSVEGGFYLIAALAQMAFYILAGLGYALRRSGWGRFKILYVPFFYCLANAAAFIAVINLLRGKRIERWQPQRHTP